MNDEFKRRLEVVERILLRFAERMPKGPKRTQAEFDRLPLLLSRRVFLEWSGLSGRALRELIEAGKVNPIVTHEGGYSLYRKEELGRLAGMQAARQEARPPGITGK